MGVGARVWASSSVGGVLARKSRRRGTLGCHVSGLVVVRGLGTSAVLDRCLVATSPATWHLDAVLKRSVVGAGELAHLGSLPSVPVHAVMPLSSRCSRRRRRPPRGPRGGSIVILCFSEVGWYERGMGVLTVAS